MRICKYFDIVTLLKSNNFASLFVLGYLRKRNNGMNFNTFFAAVFSILFIGSLSLYFFKNYFLKIPVFTAMGIGLVGFLCVNIFKLSSLNMIAPLALFYVVLFIFLEYGLETATNLRLKSLINFILVDRRHFGNPDISTKNLFHSQWNKNVFVFGIVFSIEQIFAYISNNSFLKYDASTSAQFEIIQSSSLFIPLAVTLLFFFFCKLLVRKSMKE